MTVSIQNFLQDIAKAKASDLANEKNIQFVEADVTKSSECVLQTIQNHMPNDWCS